MVRLVAETLQLAQNDAVLDVGCGFRCCHPAPGCLRAPAPDCSTSRYQRPFPESNAR
jgi:hypothetical protein